ncbi:MAG: YbhB/YbcL family Raf kinase inhibitor-like protein [Actinomycetota bacterium]|nr:YbhB/YbcL family Raf kinase inhibitor-like protein [Actinomycetota bacterium]
MTAFELRSDAFRDFELFPEQHTAVSPPLRWTDPPAETRSLALVVERRPKEHTPWEETLATEPETYWLAWGLPPHAGHLDAGASLLREGAGVTGAIGYRPTHTPQGHRRVLVFRLLALSEELQLERGATRVEFMLAAAGLVLAEADLEAVWEPGKPLFYERVRNLLNRW